MIEADTIRLLRECDAGIKMGVASIDEVLPQVHAVPLHRQLADCKAAHESLKQELQGLLHRYGDGGKEPNPMARGMSWLKTNMKLAMEPGDAAIAGLMTDGCNMGVKSLNRYLNRYAAADEFSKDMAKRLIKLEQQLSSDLQSHV